MTAAEIASRVPSSRPYGNGFRGPCLAHGSDNWSTLSIRDGNQGTLLHCFLGCSTSDVVAALGLAMRDLFPPNDEWRAPQRPIVAPSREEVRAILRTAATDYRRRHDIDASQRLLAVEINTIRRTVAARLGVSLPPIAQSVADSATGGYERDPLWPFLLERAWVEAWIVRDGELPCCPVDSFTAHGAIGIAMLDEAERSAASILKNFTLRPAARRPRRIA